MRFEKLIRVTRGTIRKRFLFKEYEPQEAKKSVFKKKKESIPCISCANLMSEIPSTV